MQLHTFIGGWGVKGSRRLSCTRPIGLMKDKREADWFKFVQH